MQMGPSPGPGPQFLGPVGGSAFSVASDIYFAARDRSCLKFKGQTISFPRKLVGRRGEHGSPLLR